MRTLSEVLTEAQAPRTHAAQRESARRAGRGFLSITGSKVYFLVAGTAAQLLLPRLLGSPEAFGLYSAAISFVSILNNVLIGASVQVVSKRVSEAPTQSDYTLRKALVLQLSVGLLLSGAMFLSAETLAEDLLKDPLLTPLFRLSSSIVLAYALYTAFVGTLNGRQHFLTQARFDMGYTTLRTLGMVGAAALGFGALGVFCGFALASWSVLVIAAYVVGLGRHSPSSDSMDWLRFMAPLWLYQLCLNLILQVDITLLKGSVATLLRAHETAAIAADTASRFAGFYRAAETFAFVPYQLIMAVVLVIFPMVSEAVALGDESAASRYVRTALRFSLLVLLALAAPMAGAARGVMRLVYPAAYAQGAEALAILVLAMVCFALFVLAATIMTGAGKPGLAASVGVVAVGVVVAGNIGFVRYVGVGEYTLGAAALGTGSGTLVALCAMGYAVYHRFGAFIPVLTVLRATLAGAVAFAVSRQLTDTSVIHTMIALTLGASIYALLLVLLRELTSQDLGSIRDLLRRKRA